jgi:hypothetical protein
MRCNYPCTCKHLANLRLFRGAKGNNFPSGVAGVTKRLSPFVCALLAHEFLEFHSQSKWNKHITHNEAGRHILFQQLLWRRVSPSRFVESARRGAYQTLIYGGAHCLPREWKQPQGNSMCRHQQRDALGLIKWPTATHCVFLNLCEEIETKLKKFHFKLKV